MSKNRPDYTHPTTPCPAKLSFSDTQADPQAVALISFGFQTNLGEQFRFTVSHWLIPNRQMSYSETVLPPIVPMAGMAYKASVGTDQLPAPGNVSLLIGRGQRATHGRRLGMKDKMKKASAAVGTPLIMAGVLVAAMHVAVNAHAIQEYCSKAVFKGLEIVIASQTEGETH